MSSEIKIAGVKQYKGVLRPYKPTLVNAITSPISFTHHLLNKKSRNRRKTKRYKKILSKSYLLED
jgi:ribosomal protein L35